MKYSQVLALLAFLSGCDASGLANVKAIGPDAHGVVCYIRPANSSALSCVKVGGGTEK